MAKVTTEQTILDVVEVHNFKKNFTVAASGDVDVSFNISEISESTGTYYLTASTSFVWTPDNSEDKFHPSVINSSLGNTSRVAGFAEGSGTLTVYAKGLSGVYYTGNTDLT